MAMCHHCGEAEHFDQARYCHQCGLPMIKDREARKNVTVVFTDVKDSVQLAEQVDEEQLRPIMGRFYDMAREVFERQGGTLQKFMGDAVMAVFGSPRLQEDDPLRAVRAANDLRGAVAKLNKGLKRDFNVKLQVHTGVNTGEAVVGSPLGGVSILLGDAVNVAARLEQAAGAGETLMSESTYQQVREVVEAEQRLVRLKGKGRQIPAWRLQDVLQRARRVRSGAPMVGREHDLNLLKVQVQRAATEQRCHLVIVSGESGVGKTRLVEEFREIVRDSATVLRGSCPQYGDSNSPLKELLIQAAATRHSDPGAGVVDRLGELANHDERVIARIAPILRGGFAEDQDTFRALRRIFYLLAEERPLVLVIDDLQWARPALLDFIEQAAASSRRTQVLVVCIARSEFFENRERANWGRHFVNATFMRLTQLNEEQTGELIRRLLKEGEVPADVQALLQEKAAGIPFFVEEFIAMLTEQKALLLLDGSWKLRGDPAAIQAPTTIEQILASRLDQLDVTEKLVIERAAVIGTPFTAEHLAALAPDVGPAVITGTLHTLVRKGLLSGEESAEDGAGLYQFRHVLTQETAYRRVPKADRAALHESFVDWLERRMGAVMPPDEVIGLHLEKASKYRAELNHAQAAQELARRAGERLAAAGHRGASDATALLRRALELLPQEHPGRLVAMLDLADSFREGDLEQAKASYDRVVEAAGRARDRRVAMYAILGKVEVVWFHHFRGDWEEGRHDVDLALRVFDELDDDLGRAKARRLLAYMHMATGHSTAAQREAEVAILLAHRAGDDRLEAQIRRLYGVVLFWGPTPLDEVKERNEEAARWARAKGMYSLEASSLSLLARIAAMRRNFDEARELNELAGRLVPDLGELLAVAADSFSEGLVELLAGDLLSAEQALRRGYSALERRGAPPAQANVAAMLARVLYLQGRDGEALRQTEVCESLSAEGQLDTRIKWRAVRALVLARRGQFDLAEKLAREALRLAVCSEQLDTRAEAFTDLAEILAQTGDQAKRQEAGELLKEALTLYIEKGNLVAADRPDALMRELDSH
jgi:class 3 adenylate cyclase/tetratricopeptide (TPR) repeat protein